LSGTNSTRGRTKLRTWMGEAPAEPAAPQHARRRRLGQSRALPWRKAALRILHGFAESTNRSSRADSNAGRKFFAPGAKLFRLGKICGGFRRPGESTSLQAKGRRVPKNRRRLTRSQGGSCAPPNGIAGKMWKRSSRQREHLCAHARLTGCVPATRRAPASARAPFRAARRVRLLPARVKPGCFGASGYPAKQGGLL